jgi:hypothetical protein
MGKSEQQISEYRRWIRLADANPDLIILTRLKLYQFLEIAKLEDYDERFRRVLSTIEDTPEIKAERLHELVEGELSAARNILIEDERPTEPTLLEEVRTDNDTFPAARRPRLPHRPSAAEVEVTDNTTLEDSLFRGFDYDVHEGSAFISVHEVQLKIPVEECMRLHSLSDNDLREFLSVHFIVGKFDISIFRLTLQRIIDETNGAELA